MLLTLLGATILGSLALYFLIQDLREQKAAKAQYLKHLNKRIAANRAKLKDVEETKKLLKKKKDIPIKDIKKAVKKAIDARKKK